VHEGATPVRADVPESGHTIFALEEDDVIPQELEAHGFVLDLLGFYGGVPVLP